MRHILGTDFPHAVYQALVDHRHRWVYVAAAAAMFAAMMAISRAGVVILLAELITILLLARRGGRMASTSLRRAVLGITALGIRMASVVGSEMTIANSRNPEPYRPALLSSLAMIADRHGSALDSTTGRPAYERFDNGLACQPRA